MAEGNGSNGLGENTPVRRSDVVPTIEVPAPSAQLTSDTHAGVHQSQVLMQALNQADTSLSRV